VHGAARDAIAYVERVIAIELSSATDETYVIPARAGPGFEAVSSGNFHGAPVAIAFDVLGLALAHLGAVAERRTAKLVSSPDSGFPLYLTPREAGLHAGLMEAQVTATALAAENRALARPASLDSIPTSEVEDLLSLGPAAARKARQILENVELIAAIELMAAVQALEFHVPLCSTPALEAVRGAVRDFVAPLDVDRALSQDMSRTTALLRDGMILRRVEEALGGALD
jgi:histidine ammonia-lyase